MKSDSTIAQRNVSHGQAFRSRDQECPRGSPEQDRGRLSRHCDQGRKGRPARDRKFRPRARKEVFDAKNRLAFPGCVDAHMHIGIYAPLAQDAVSESKAAAMGGVTSSLNYLRTGHYYLNRGGPYREFMPEVHKQSDGRFLGRLRLPPCADRSRAHRRDGISRHRARRHVVQDLHVLRRLRAARRARRSRTNF